MATAGLSFANPFLEKVSVGESPNPYAPFSPTSSIGLGGLGPSAADLAVAGDALVKQSQFTMPEMKQPPAIAFSPSSNQLFVNGITFAADDASSALQSEQYLTGPGTGLPQGGDWVPLDQQAYAQYLSSIRNPSLGRLAAKNFGRGVDVMQALSGRALQLAGAEELGGRIVARQEADLAKTQPFERMFTDIESGKGAVDWFVANFAQQGPNLIESVITAGLGFLGGTAVGGPAAGAGGALAGLMGKTAFKEAVIAAAKKKAGGEVLNAAENKLLREAAGIAGAVATSYTQNLATGAADIYGELREQGANADDVDARLKALAGSIPYAALESLPEFLLAGRLLGGVGAPRALPAGAGRLQRGAELLRRGVVGGAVGGTAEGLTEAGQEGLLLGISDQDLTSPEAVNRLVNSFAAGFGVGGPIGAVANLKGKQPANLLNPAQNPDPTPGRNLIVPPTTPSGPTPRGVTPMGVMPSPPEALAGPSANVPQLPAPTQPVTPMGGPMMMVTPEGVAYPDVMMRQQGNIPPGATPGSQGVLDIFGGAIPAQELASRMMPQAQPAIGYTPGAPTPQPGQGALQFAPPAPQPPVNPQMANQLQVIQDRMRREREFAAAQAQVAAQREAELNRLAQQSQNARDLFAMQQAQAAQVAPMPMVPVQPRTPQQMSLFNRRQAPVPSRAEGLRRGVGTALPPIPEVAPPAGRSTQIPLFTQQGQPSVAALKAAGVRTKLPPTPPKAPVVRPRTQRGLKKKGVAAVEIVPKEVPSAVQKQSAAKVPVQPRAAGGKEVGQEVRRAKEPAGKGKAKAEVKETKLGKLLRETIASRKAEASQLAIAKAQDNFDPRSPYADKLEAYKANRQALIDELKQQGKTNQTMIDEALKTYDQEFDRLLGFPKTIEAPAPKAAKGEAKLKKGPAAKAAPVVEALPPAEAWEDMKPEGAPRYSVLSLPAQQEWAGAPTKTMALAEKIAAGEITITEREPTTAEILAEEMQAAETATDTRTFRDAIQTVLYYAFFDPDTNNVKSGVTQTAQDFLANTDFNETQRAAMDAAFLDLVNEVPQIMAVVKGKERPWFAYAVARGLVGNVKAKIIALPEVYKTQASPISGKIGTTKPVQSTAERITSTPEATLGELINDLIAEIRRVTNLNQEVKYQGKTYANVVAFAKELYSQLDKRGKEYIVRGFKLKEYFTAKGEPKMLKSGGRYIITTKEYTTAEKRKIEEEQKAAAKALAEEDVALRQAEAERKRMEKEGFKEEDAWDNDDGMFYRDDGTPLTSTIPVGRVRLLVRNFLSKLRIQPKVYIYKNVADLKARNPELFARANAARKQGDFESTKSVGYAFGPNVIVFTDFVRTEQQLKFVLAHETLGHFGLRGVIPQAQLNKVLNSIYNSDPSVQAAVDAMVANQGMSKLEAIEEYLADNAAELDTSIIARLWNVLKNFLNKLGFEFRDDEARYFVNLARKYVRDGDIGQFINARTVSAGIQNIETFEEEGRYARAYAGDMASRVFGAGAFNRRYGNTGGLAGAMEAFYKNVFGARRDVPGTVARILEQVQTLDNKARRSYGLSQLYRLLEKQQQYARALLSKYQRMTAFTHSPDVFGFGKGVTEEQKEQAGELLARAALLRSQQATDELIKKYPSLVTVDEMGIIRVDPTVRAEIEKAGFVTAEEFRKGFDITYTNGEKVRFQFDVDENSPVWKVYTELRETVNDAAIDLMLSNYEASQAEAKRVISDINAMRRGGNVFTNDDLAAIRKAAEMYKAKRYEGSDVASAGVEIRKKASQDSEDFIISFGRALFNDDVYKVWVKDPTAKPEVLKDHKEFQDAQYDDLRAALDSLRAKVRNETDSFAVQKAVRDLFMFDLQSKNADYYAKRTILGSYVPFTRRGTEQVRLVAVDSRGNPVRLSENIRGTLPYFQVDSRSEAIDIAEKLDNEFGGDNEWVMVDEDGNEITVRLKAEVSRTRQSPDLTEAVNFNEFVYVLNRLNVNLAPDVRERIITTLTDQNNRARRNLQRSGTEGWDKDVVRSVSEHLETTAHVAAKKLFRHRVDDILLNNSNWLGDPEKLRNLKDAVDTAPNEGARARAKRAYDEYAYMYRYMRGSAGDNTVEIDGKEVPTLGRGEDYREEAKQVLRWYSEATNITDSTEDFLSGEAGSAIKLATVLMQLGGSVATAVVNLASLVTHSMPYLSYYNTKRGFGGGYGESKAAAALWKAAADVKNPDLSDAGFLNDMLQQGTYDRFGLTEDEAAFLFDQTEQGTLQAAQFNALVGTARGKVFNNKAQAAIKAWMSLFSYTEQMNRRTTALAAYRLEKERALAQGIPLEQAIVEAAEAARTAVNTSQGEYAMFNRPEMARGNVLQYIFMYKQFVIITVQLLRALPVKGQLLMLGFLLLTSGLKGLPFAEDIFDIVDTISQKLGLKMASVEKEIAEWVDSVAPGMTPYVMRGLMDRMTGATMSTRLGMGDLVPLSGAFRAGADPAREAADFAGPVFAGITGLVGMAGNLAKYGAEVTGLRDDTTSFNTILRESPIAAMRAIGDAYAFTSSGQITNMRGQVVSKEAPVHVILARVLGFYPAIATEQNDIVRLSKYVTEYNKAIKAEYVGAYVKAKMAGDTERMQQITDDVRQWNEDAKGTGLEISTFVKSANRAAREAERPTVERYLKSAPKGMRPETMELLRIHGLEDEIQ